MGQTARDVREPVPASNADGDAILDLMIDKELGVTTRPLTIAIVDDEYFRRSQR